MNEDNIILRSFNIMIFLVNSFGFYSVDKPSLYNILHFYFYIIVSVVSNLLDQNLMLISVTKNGLITIKILPFIIEKLENCANYFRHEKLERKYSGEVFQGKCKIIFKGINTVRISCWFIDVEISVNLLLLILEYFIY